MKPISATIKVQTRSRIYLIYLFKKHIIKHKRMFSILTILLFVFILSSCKTCKCPAYSQDNIFPKEKNGIKINFSIDNYLFAIQNPTQNNGLNN
jgi:hypothetical protein